MRYRLYSTFGLSAVEVVKIIAICTVTFVLGFCTLAGAVFTFDPLPLPELVEVRLPFTTVQTDRHRTAGAGRRVFVYERAALEALHRAWLGILAPFAPLYADADVGGHG